MAISGGNVLFEARALREVGFEERARLGEDVRLARKNDGASATRSRPCPGLIAEHRETKSYPRRASDGCGGENGVDAARLPFELRIVRVPDVAWLGWIAVLVGVTAIAAWGTFSWAVAVGALVGCIAEARWPADLRRPWASPVSLGQPLLEKLGGLRSSATVAENIPATAAQKLGGLRSSATVNETNPSTIAQKLGGLRSSATANETESVHDRTEARRSAFLGDRRGEHPEHDRTAPRRPPLLGDRGRCGWGSHRAEARWPSIERRGHRDDSHDDRAEARWPKIVGDSQRRYPGIDRSSRWVACVRAQRWQRRCRASPAS